MPTKDEVIEKFHKRFEEGAQRLYDRIKVNPEYNTMGIRVKDINEWIKNSHLTVKTKWYYKRKFNSLVAPGPKHTFQVDLFNFKYEQTVNFQNNPPPPHGLMRVDVFTKQTQIVPLRDKKATSWKDALDKLIDKMGRPKIIMTDPDASITSNEISERFKRNPDTQYTTEPSGCSSNSCTTK